MPTTPSPAPSPLTSPPSWWQEPEGTGEGDGGGSKGLGPIGGPGWPDKNQVEYLTKLIVLGLLLLALPWLIGKLLTAPHEVTGHAAGASMGIASMGAP